VALVAEKQLTIQARLAGADVKDRPRRGKGKDSYGEMLKHRSRMRDLQQEFRGSIDKCMKPL
jgi:hypothetical protein